MKVNLKFIRKEIKNFKIKKIKKCSCDANLTHIGMSTRHLSTRAKEHLDFNSQVSSAIKNHIMCCNVCSSVKLNLNSFKIIKKCKSEFYTKIHEALFIKKRNPGLNR